MNESAQTINKLLASGKGILAMDASNPTMTKRMEAVGITSTPNTRRDFRELLVTTPGLSEYISGAILYDETMHQTVQGKLFAQVLAEKGIIPGIKVDGGVKDMAGFPGEKIAEGVDGLRERLLKYKQMGAKFTKFRTVTNIGRDLPNRICMESNASIQAYQAVLVQEAGLVPIIEPEVLMEGDHNLERCEEVTRTNLKMIFIKLIDHKVDLAKIVLKTNMVLPGDKSSQQHSDIEIAEATLRVLKECVPAEVPGIVFLSGGDSPTDITQHLNAIAKEKDLLPWKITFSFERALEGPVMEIWAGKSENKIKAQAVLLERAKAVSLASDGQL